MRKNCIILVFQVNAVVRDENLPNEASFSSNLRVSISFLSTLATYGARLAPDNC